MKGLQEYKLGDILDVTRGATLSGEYYANDGEHIRLTLGHFDYINGGFKQNTSKDNLYFNGPVRDEFILHKGDIITPLTEQTFGLIGSTALIPESGKYIQSQDVGLVKCEEDRLLPEFCYYLLPTDMVKNQLSAGAQQTSIRHTSPDKIKACKVFIPDTDAQRRIARLLSSIDRKIAVNRAINQNLEAMVKQHYDYWFVQFDFPNEEGKPYKSSGGAMTFYDCLGMEIPSTWKICQLHDFINSHNTGDWGTDKPLDKNSIQVGCIRGADILKLNNLPTRYIKGNNTCKLLRPWDIVIEVSGGSPVQATGRSALITDGVIERNGGKITCSNFCHAFSMNNPEEAVYFFFLWRVLYDNDLMFNFEGKTSGIKNFMTDAFLANYWYKADDKLISSFFEKVNPLIAQMNCNIKENNQLIQQRDELLPLLMNGQVSVTQLNSDLSAY